MSTKNLKYLKLWESFSSDWEEMNQYHKSKKKKDDEIADMNFSSGRDVYDFFGDEYPLASDLIAWLIFGSEKDNALEGCDEYQLNTIGLDYEYSWMYNMEDIEEQIKSLIGEDDETRQY